MLVLLLISKTNIVASDLCMYKGTKFWFVSWSAVS
jgi:hypothetical protein